MPSKGGQGNIAGTGQSADLSCPGAGCINQYVSLEFMGFGLDGGDAIPSSTDARYFLKTALPLHGT